MRRLRIPAILALTAAIAAALVLGALGGAERPPNPTAPSGLQGKQFLRMAALGDSITLGVNACEEQGECRNVSWSTGNDGGVVSLAANIGEVTGHQPATSNFARAGARAADLPAQAAAAVADRANLVTIMVGGNDICMPSPEAMTPAAEYSAAVKEALVLLDSAPEKPLVFIASVPHLAGLLSAHSNHPAAIRMWRQNQVCQSLLEDPASSSGPDQERRSAVAARVDQYNLVLAEQCAELSRCIFDGGAVATIDFSAGQISDLDYFHPSREGQAMISGTSWAALVDAIDHCELPPALKRDFGC